MEEISPVSPCKRICIMKDNACIGCYRTIDEIKKWTKLSDKQKIKILKRIKELNRDYNDMP